MNLPGFIHFVESHAALGALLAATFTAALQLFASWRLQLQQRELNALLQREQAAHQREIELLRGQVDRAVGLHRAHFEVELRALQQIWDNIAAVRSQFDLQSWRGEPLEDMRQRVWALVQAVDNQSPFYPPEIYTPLDELRMMVRTEVEEAAAEVDDRPTDYRARRNEQRREFHRRVNQVSSLIRARLAKVTVVNASV